MAVIEKISDFLDGQKTFKRTLQNEEELLEVVNKGFPTSVLTSIQNKQLLNKDEIYQLIISERTWLRRKKEKFLTNEDSDKLARVIRVIAYASDVFEDDEKTRTWLRTPNPALKGMKPIELLKTDTGARLVESILNKIECGVYS